MINRDAIEQAAEASALRVLVQTVAMLTFEHSGLSPDGVRALARRFAAEMADIAIPGADDATVATVREANAAAIEELFDAVADGMRDEGPADAEA